MGRLLTRRDVLGGGAALLAASALPAMAARSGPVILGARQSLDARTGKPSYALAALTRVGKPVLSLSVPFHPHGFAGNPARRRYAALFEKQGPGAAVVDLVDKVVVRTLPPTQDGLFYGHGAFSPDGALLYATETRPATMEGRITVRDGKTYRELGQMASHGAAPHDCHLLEDGRVMVVTHGGGALGDDLDPPSVSWVDVRSEKLLDKLYIPGRHLNAGHVVVGSKGDVAVVSAPRRGLPASEHGGVTLRFHGTPAQTVTEPSEVVGRLVGEVLSVALHEPSLTVAATNPDGNLLTFWDVATGALRRSVPLARPRGALLTPDQKWFAVTHGEATPRMSFFSVSSLAREQRSDIPDANLTGSHIYDWVA